MLLPVVMNFAFKVTIPDLEHLANFEINFYSRGCCFCKSGFIVKWLNFPISNVQPPFHVGMKHFPNVQGGQERTEKERKTITAARERTEPACWSKRKREVLDQLSCSHTHRCLCTCTRTCTHSPKVVKEVEQTIQGTKRGDEPSRGNSWVSLRSFNPPAVWCKMVWSTSNSDSCATFTSSQSPDAAATKKHPPTT